MYSGEYKLQYRETLKLAFPVVLSQLGHVMVSVVDSMMVGRIGTLPLAAASLGNSIFTVVMVFGLGLSFSMTPLVATAAGRGNKLRIAMVLLNGVLICVVLGLLLAFSGYFAAPLLRYLNQPDDVVALAIPYLRILLLSLIPLMCFQGFKQFAEGLSLTMQAMYITVFANLLNIIGNYILIYGKLGLEPMGLNGAGLSTLLSRVVMALAIFGYIAYSKRFEIYRQYLKLEHLSAVYIGRLTRLGIPIALQMIFEMGAFSFSAVMIGWIGTRELAAHQIAISIASVTYMMASGVAAAATIRVGNNRGLGNYHSMRIAGNSSFVLAVLFMAFCALCMVAGREFIPKMYIDDPEVMQIAAGLLVVAGLFQLSDGVQVVGLGALRGLEDVRVPSFISLLAYWLVGLPLGYVLCFVAGFGVNGIWAGLLTGLTVAAVLLFLRFQKFSRQVGT